ncbi:MAG: hypothetical protein M3R36_10665 [Bacteroidota bacterium]|nr:hypothetical protein [Bacteroidota bacterium]
MTLIQLQIKKSLKIQEILKRLRSIKEKEEHPQKQEEEKTNRNKEKSKLKGRTKSYELH